MDRLNVKVHSKRVERADNIYGMRFRIEPMRQLMGWLMQHGFDKIEVAKQTNIKKDRIQKWLQEDMDRIRPVELEALMNLVEEVGDSVRAAINPRIERTM